MTIIIAALTSDFKQNCRFSSKNCGLLQNLGIHANIVGRSDLSLCSLLECNEHDHSLLSAGGCPLYTVI